MTKSKILVIIVLLVGMVSNVFAIDLTQWQYKAEVAVEDGTGEYGRLILTPGIYDAARLDLADIRLLDAQDRQVPYVLAKAGDIAKKHKYSPALINRSTNTEEAAMVTLDFGKQVVKNSIEVETAGNNFRRAVKIEGSNDNVEFFTIVEEAYVFAIDYNTRFEQVDLPVNDYRYLRITVKPMATEEKSPVIDDVKAHKVEKTFAQRQPVQMLQTEHSEDEKSKSSIYVYDLAYRHLPVCEIKLEVTDNAFYRCVTVDGRDAATRKVRVDSEDNRQRFREVEVRWNRIISRTIYRYTDADGKRREKLALRIASSRGIYRYLRITIRNYDDRPLTVESASAKMITDNIVFAAQDDVPSALYFGAKSATKPQYDLARRLRRPLLVQARMAKLGDITDNPLFGKAEPRPLAWTEKHKVLLWIIMGVVVVVLAGFILKSFKSIQSKQVQS